MGVNGKSNMIVPVTTSTAIGMATNRNENEGDDEDEDDGTAYLASRAKMSQTSAVSDLVRRRNRRKRYLELHPEYFGPQLELADLLLYDRLIRRFQTTAERELEGRKKGYSGVLEADLVRSEAKIDALRHPDPNSHIVYKRGPDGEILAEERDEVPGSKEEGYDRWKYVMERRFVEGRDSDFDYGLVDGAEELDAGEQDREMQDKWFEEQSPDWVDDDGPNDEKELKGETGVQDF